MKDKSVKPIPVRFKEEEYEEVKKLADQTGLPVQDILRRSVRLAVPRFVAGEESLLDYAEMKMGSKPAA